MEAVATQWLITGDTDRYQNGIQKPSRDMKMHQFCLDYEKNWSADSTLKLTNHTIRSKELEGNNRGRVCGRHVSLTSTALWLLQTQTLISLYVTTAG